MHDNKKDHISFRSNIEFDTKIDEYDEVNIKEID